MNDKKFAVKHIIFITILVHTILTVVIMLCGGYLIVKQNGVQVYMTDISLFVWLSILIGLIVVVIGYIISLYLNHIITEPIEHFTEAIRHFHHKKISNHLLNIGSNYLEVDKLKNELVYIFSNIKKELKHLRIQSNIDPLTGIGNRRLVDDILTEWIRENKACSIIMLDLDYFKKVNDTSGHVVGDLVLKFLVEQMNNIIRESDISCRYGGEEFLILLPNTTINSAYIIAEKLRFTMATTNSPSGYPVTLSAGIAAYPSNKALTLDDLLKSADEALYKAKKNGRNLVQNAE